MVWAAPLLLFLFQAPAVLAAREGRLPIGGRPDGDGGAAEVAAVLAAAPYGTVLYDHAYSWQWRYHFHGGKVAVVWMAHPAALVEDLRVFGGNGQPRYLALPAGPAAQPWLEAVRAADYRPAEVHVARPAAGRPGVTLYRIWPADGH
jgi:hypothetical protein